VATTLGPLVRSSSLSPPLGAMSDNTQEQDLTFSKVADDDRLDIDTQTQTGRDRSTRLELVGPTRSPVADPDCRILISDAYFPPNVPPSSPQGAIVVPFTLPSPVTAEGDTSFSRSIDAILSTQTEREVAEE